MIISELNKIKAVKFGDVDISKVYSGKDKVFPEEGGYFYVCHSSTGLIEKFPVTNSVDWPSLVTENHTYGGLYSDWAGKGDYAKAIEAGTLDDSLFVDNKLQDVNYNSYDGSVADASHRFAKAKAYKSIQIPIKDKIYYICEPLDGYFKIYTRYFINDKNVGFTYVIMPTDSNYYSAINVEITNNDASIQTQAHFTPSATIQCKEDTTKYIKVSVNDLNTNLVRGYTATFRLESLDFMLNSWYKFQFIFSTLDGYEKRSNFAYIYTGDLTTDTFIAQNYPPTT